MVDLYNEVGYIKTVIASGLSQKWERDITLYVRFLKMTQDVDGKKRTKQAVKTLAREKIEKAVNREHNPIRFDHLQDYARFNSVVDKAWKNDKPLREIEYLEISKEVLDWFLNLPDTFVMSDEQVKIVQTKRPKVKIKKNRKQLKFEHSKYLFTLYIWSLLQKEYLGEDSRYFVHYIDQYKKKFKHDANLKDSFSLNNERNLLYDLGFINVNYALGIEAKFMFDNEVFQTPITDKNRVVIIGSKNDTDGDLINCGYWLEKQKYGSFVCKNCGKEFFHYSNLKQEKARKYCKECSAKIIHGKLPENQREVKCIDCGKIIYVSNKDHNTIRCGKCQKKAKALSAKESMQRIRADKKIENNNLLTEQAVSSKVLEPA